MGSNLSQWDQKRPTYTVPVSSLLAPRFTPSPPSFLVARIPFAFAMQFPFYMKKALIRNLLSLFYRFAGAYSLRRAFTYFFRGGGDWIVRAGRVSPSMNSFFQTGFQDSKVFSTLTPPTHSLFKPFLHAGNTFTLLSY